MVRLRSLYRTRRDKPNDLLAEVQNLAQPQRNWPTELYELGIVIGTVCASCGGTWAGVDSNH
jgi:hypothetical protein